MSSGQAERRGDRASVFYGEVPALVAAPASLNLWHNGNMAGDATATVELAGDTLVRSVEQNFGYEVLAPKFKRIKVISNRLPFELLKEDDGSYKKDKNGHYKAKTSPGGLVTALTPILRSGEFDGKWIGWPGGFGEVEKEGLAEALRTAANGDYDANVVELKKEEYDGYYEGYSNQVLWPLFHSRADLVNPASLKNDWGVYQQVNEKFAKAVTQDESDPILNSDFIWVQDYQLLSAGKYIKRETSQPVAHFLHIPFPEPEQLEMLPAEQREMLLSDMLHYDVVGFQTAKDMENFARNVRTFLPDATVRNDGDNLIIELNDLKTRAQVFPISIDINEFEYQAGLPKTQEITKKVQDIMAERRELGEIKNKDVKLVFSVGRSDYTKGFKEELVAIRRFFEKYPKMIGKVEFIQASVTSRGKIDAYKEYNEELRNLSQSINADYGVYETKEDGTKGRWLRRVVHQIKRNMGRERLLAHYEAADVMMVSSLADGMNLVAKEYGIVGKDKGVLILGENVGVVHELGDYATVVNPLDADAFADKLYEALTMDEPQKDYRRHRLYDRIGQNTIFDWANKQIKAFLEIWDEKRQVQIANTPAPVAAS